MTETKEEPKHTTTAQDASKQAQQDLAFDEDAFEEFEGEDWAIITHEEENQDLWQADWDDEDISDDFQRLQGALQATKPAPMSVS